jgi:hypothetical protein
MMPATTEARDLAVVGAVISHAGDKEQYRGDDPVREHVEDRARDPRGGHGGHAQQGEAHVADRRVGDELLEILLRQTDEGGVDDVDSAEQGDGRGRAACGLGQKRVVEAQDAVRVQIRSHRYGVAKLDHLCDEGAWVGMPRLDHNYFVAASGRVPGPYTLRVTDVIRAEIEDMGVPHIENGDSVGTNSSPPARRPGHHPLAPGR